MDFYVALFLIVRARVIDQSLSTGLSAGGIKNFALALLMFTGKAILPFYQSVLPIVNWPSVLLSAAAIALVIAFSYKQGFKSKGLATLGLGVFFILLIIPTWFGAFKSGGEHYEHRAYTSLAGLALYFSQVKFDLTSKTFQN